MREFGGSQNQTERPQEYDFSIPIETLGEGVRKGKKEIYEYSLQSLENEGAVQRASEKLGLVRGARPKEEKLQKSWDFFYAQLSKAISEESIKKQSHDKEYIMNSAGTSASKIEAQLLAMFAARVQKSHMANTTQMINDTMTNLKRNVSYGNTSGQLTPESIATFFNSRGVGLKSALDCYISRIELPIKPGQKRIMFLQDQLDTEAAVDFVEIIIDTNNGLEISELNFIQVKSKLPTESEQWKIEFNHETLAGSMTKKFGELQSRYNPENDIPISDDEKINLFMDILDKCIENNLGDQERAKQFNILMENSLSSELLNKATTNGKFRYRANQLVALLKDSISIGAVDYLLSLDKLISDYIRSQPAKGQKVIIDHIRSQEFALSKDFNADDFKLLTKSIHEIIDEFKIDGVAEKLLVTLIKSVNSITTIGQTVVKNKKLLDIATYMTMRSH